MIQVKKCTTMLLAALLIRAAGSAFAGTPYLIQWPNTGEVLTHMHFTGITWDDDQAADNAGTGEVQLHGFYGKTHINDDTNGGKTPVVGGDNQIYAW